MFLFGSSNRPKSTFKIGTNQFAVIRFELEEGLSSLFKAELSVASTSRFDYELMIENVGVLEISERESVRYVHGIVSRFEKIRQTGRFFIYDIILEPHISLLNFRQDCRIFQKKRTSEIIKEVLNAAGILSNRFEFRLKGESILREYCVQYCETDFHFISRLIAEEGIFFFFEHTEDEHLLVFGNSEINYMPIKGSDNIVYREGSGMVGDEEYIFSFRLSRNIHSGKVSLNDYNYERPSLYLLNDDYTNSHDNLEIYDYPGKFMLPRPGEEKSKVRLEGASQFKFIGKGKGISPRLIPGFTFKLTNHPMDDLNQSYFIVDIKHKATQPQVLEALSGAKEKSTYINEFTVIPASFTYRPHLKISKPIIRGIQTATVTGPEKEEIYTDKLGRVKVQFHWDRLGSKDERSSCWIRVNQAWAGNGWGIVFIPRIGQEVIVDFIEGDPDRPIITGSVYNGRNPLPYDLTEEKTISTIQSNSTPNGKGFNEIRLNDAKGSEEIFIHGEKDLEMTIKNDRKESIGNDRHLTVTRDKLEKVDRDKHIKIERDEIKEVQRDINLTAKGKMTTRIDQSNTIEVNGDMIEHFKNNHHEKTDKVYSLNARNIVMDAKSGFTIKSGENFITIDASGIFINGTKIHINSGGKPLTSLSANTVPPTLPTAAFLPANGNMTHANEIPDTHNAPWHPSTSAQNTPPSKPNNNKENGWIEIEMVDDFNTPMAGQRYEITLPDGKTMATGTTDPDGIARVEGFAPGDCKISFPDLDKDSWERI